jgi:hypothetical protein
MSERIRAFTGAAERQLQFPDTTNLIRELLAKVHQANDTLMVELQEAGAVRPFMALVPPEVPLQLVKTAATHRLAQVLREAVAIAQEVDKERAWEEAGLADAIRSLATSARIGLD